MVNAEHVAILRQGTVAWNAWRDDNPHIRPDLSAAVHFETRGQRTHGDKADLSGVHLSGANLSGVDLSGAKFSGANLSRANLVRVVLFDAVVSGANLFQAHLTKANLNQADLSGANLGGAHLSEANLYEANLTKANLMKADLRGGQLFDANLSGANLSGANLSGADLRRANLSGADLSGANLGGAHFNEAHLNGANLSGAKLEYATLVDTDFTGADLTGCRIFGISAWRLKLDGAKQQNLFITPEVVFLEKEEPTLTIDNIEVAQFIYLLLHNENIRGVIDTVTSKAVLILGRFTHERKAVLDALREELRKRNYLPILFDFEVPARRNITETITLLARMARFIIADLTDPSSIPQELQAIIPSVRVPVQPVLLEGSSLYSMFKDFDPRDFHWVLPVYEYKEPKQLLATFPENVIAPAEGKAKELEERRRTFEAELTKPR
jgi:uncharacterized protein YjbI with pentapeptide repeats